MQVTPEDRVVPDHMTKVVPYSRASDLPSDFDEYDQSRHFRDMQTCRRDPPITESVIETVLEHGRVELHDGDDPFDHESRRHIKLDVNGEYWHVVIAIYRDGERGPNRTDNFELLTAFTPSHDHIHIDHRFDKYQHEAQ